MAFCSREPLGEERKDLRMGILCALIANVNRSSDRKAYEALDFIPKFWARGGEETVSEKAMAIFSWIKEMQERKAKEHGNH